MPPNMVQTEVPAIDVFNCLLESQKILSFSVAGESHYELLALIDSRPTPTL